MQTAKTDQTGQMPRADAHCQCVLGLSDIFGSKCTTCGSNYDGLMRCDTGSLLGPGTLRFFSITDKGIYRPFYF